MCMHMYEVEITPPHLSSKNILGLMNLGIFLGSTGSLFVLAEELGHSLWGLFNTIKLVGIRDSNELRARRESSSQMTDKEPLEWEPLPPPLHPTLTRGRSEDLNLKIKNQHPNSASRYTILKQNIVSIPAREVLGVTNHPLPHVFSKLEHNFFWALHIHEGECVTDF